MKSKQLTIIPSLFSPRQGKAFLGVSTRTPVSITLENNRSGVFYSNRGKSKQGKLGVGKNEDINARKLL